MRNFFAAFIVAIAAFSLGAGPAEAARLGSGKSVGMQRQSVAPKPATPSQQATPNTPATPTPTAAPAAPKRNWLGPLAGLAAGLGIAALLSHFGIGEGFANALMLGLLVMGAFFAFRLLFRRPNPESAGANELRYAHGVDPTGTRPAHTMAMPASGGGGTPSIPDGFDAEAFIRVAKLNFVRLQAANDAGNLNDIREFVTPEMFAEISLQLSERQGQTQQTDVVTLNAELLEVVTEGPQHIASVRFNGLIRESAGSAAAPFDEIWNLSKPVNGSHGWAIAGIQQLQ